MKEKLKDFCEQEIHMVTRWNADVNLAQTRCYGAVMFVLSQCEIDNAEIIHWWDNEMLPLFQKLKRRKKL